MKEDVLKNGLAIEKLENIFIYCNEKDKKRGNFLFKCCKGCKHNPLLENL